MAVALIAVLAGALTGRFDLHGPVTQRSLFDAVEQASGSEGATYDLGGYRRMRDEGRRWRCEVWTLPAAKLRPTTSG